eukprot:765136-Hanusia_phi.AAC.1
MTCFAEISTIGRLPVRLEEVGIAVVETPDIVVVSRKLPSLSCTNQYLSRDQSSLSFISDIELLNLKFTCKTRFGGIEGRLKSQSELECKLPNLRLVHEHTLFFALHADSCNSPLFAKHFVISEALSVTSVEPRENNYMEHTTITICGKGFPPMLTKIFESDGKLLRSLTKTSTKLLVHLPARKAEGNVKLYFTSDNDNRFFVGLFRFINPPSIYEIIPSITKARNTLVTLIGRGFHETSSVKLGEHVSCQMIANAPSLLISNCSNLQEGNYSVLYSGKGMTFLNSNLRIQVTSSEKLIVNPSGGVVLRGSYVSITSSLHKIDFCELGKIEIRATISSNDEYFCRIPKKLQCNSSSCIFPFTVYTSQDMFNYKALFHTFFNLHEFQIISIQPTLIIQQTVSLISIFGRNFRDIERLFCQIASFKRQLSFVRSDLLVCDISPVSDGGLHQIQVRNDRGYQKEFVLDIRPGFEIRTISPKALNYSDLAVKSTICLYGGPFPDGLSYACRVGKNSLVKAIRFDDERVCFTVSSLPSGNHSVDLLMNQQDRALSKQFLEVVQDQLFKYIVPSKSPLVGGGTVTVYGHFIVPQVLHLICQFGNRSANLTCVNRMFALCAIPEGSAAIGRMEVIDLSISIVLGSFPFHFETTSVPILLSLHPSKLTIGNSNIILALGANFSSGMYCNFGNHVSRLYSFENSCEVFCKPPTLSDPSELGFFLSNNDGITSNTIAFLYEDIFRTQVDPQTVINGVTKFIRIEFSSNVLAKSLSCILGDIIVPTSSENNQILCLLDSLSWNSGEYLLEVIHDNSETSQTLGAVEILEIPELLKISPNDVKGSQKEITLFGKHFKSGKHAYSCYFGYPKYNMAEFLSSTSVKCWIAAPQKYPDSVSIIVHERHSVSRLIFSNTLWITYDFKLSLIRVELPGDSPGRLLVVALNAHILNFAYCVINGRAQNRAALVLSSTLLKCVETCAYDATNFLQVHYDGGLYSNIITFPSPAKIYLNVSIPWKFTFNIDRYITVTGSCFLPFQTFTCNLGGKRSTTAQWRSSTVVVCPVYKVPVGNFSFYLKSESAISDRIMISIENPKEGIMIQPSFGPSHGGHFVFVQSYQTFYRADLICIMFNAKQWYILERVNNRYIFPKVRSGQWSLNFVSQKMNVFRNFSVYEAEILHYTKPQNGPFQTPFRITVYGKNFLLDAAVRFSKDIIEATILSSTKLICIVPPKKTIERNSSVISVSNNGVHFSSSTLTFAYITPVKFISISPQIVSCEEGVQEVTVIGENFDRQSLYQCSFGGRDSVLAD